VRVLNTDEDVALTKLLSQKCKNPEATQYTTKAHFKTKPRVARYIQVLSEKVVRPDYLKSSVEPSGSCIGPEAQTMISI
jgi:hypothetical protein